MTRQPNVVLILVDDMGYGDFGVFSAGRTRTPHLDALVQDGICLTQHYAASPVCAPSRAGLLTGRYPHRTGAIDTLDARGLDRLALRERTLGDTFTAAGYATGLIGKWHLGAADARYHPNARGFAEFCGFRGGWWDYYDWTLDRNGSFEQSDGRYLTDVLTEEAVQFVRRHQREPFFLHLAYNAPHFPLQAPEPLLARYRETGQFSEGVCRVYAMVERMDEGVGRLCEELDRLGLADNTLILFTSDNGPQFGGTGEMSTTRFNCNWNGHKGLTYEGGLRVPALLRWPERLPAGEARHELVHFVDWLPTLAAAAEIAPPEGPRRDGVNVWPLLTEGRGHGCARRFWQWNRYTPRVETNAAMREGDWKLVRPALLGSLDIDAEEGRRDQESKHAPEHRTSIFRGEFPALPLGAAPPAELYNLAEDPGEQHDLAAEEPALAARMLDDLEDWFAEVEGERATIADVW